jgi:Plasmid maintenance system antidote protein
MNSLLKDRFKLILKEQDLSVSELATVLGVSTNYIYKLLGGQKTVISLTMAKLVEKTYGYDANWLLNGKTTDNKSFSVTEEILKKLSSMSTEDLYVLNDFVKTLEKRRKKLMFQLILQNEFLKTNIKVTYF